MKEWQEFKNIVKEVEVFQQKMAALNNRAKKRLLTRGGQRNTSPYVKKPSLKRSKSAPPGYGAMGEAVAIVPELHDELNPEIWTPQNKLDPQIAERLLRIARDFYDKLDLPTEILDITFTGSMANYNWTKQSDIDLHIVIDYTDVNEDIELVKNYLMEAKSNWNRNHEIMMKGHEVEIYVQDSNEPHHSTAVYSILEEEWEIVPQKEDFEVSEDAVRQKAEVVKKMIELIEELFEEGRYEEVYGDSERLREKLRKYRQCGLEKGGEFSVENLVFKLLRNEGEMDKIYNLKKNAYDAMMSVEESQR